MTALYLTMYELEARLLPAKIGDAKLILHPGQSPDGNICYRICQNLLTYMPGGGKGRIVCGREKLKYLRNKVIHFWEQFDYFGAPPPPVDRSNILIATWHHGHTIVGDRARGWDGFARILDYQRPLFRILCENSIARDSIVAVGVPAEKIVTIPQGVDRRLFRPALDAQGIEEFRLRHKIPNGVFVVGSFQKDDGVPGKDGFEPKLVKGPDVLVETVARISRDVPVHAVLTAPVRGYVRRRLDALGIEYTAPGRVSIAEMSSWYQACDVCLVTSRDEGGPAAVLESMACGVPLVATRVGMAADLIRNGANGFLCDLEDSTALAKRALQVFQDTDCRNRCVSGGLLTAEAYDWGRMAPRYWNELYRPVLESMNS